MRLLYLLWLGCFFSSSCNPALFSEKRRKGSDFKPNDFVQESDYFLVILVDAKHLDYSNTRALFKSLARSKNGEVGHAWIYLKGNLNAVDLEIEGGHSGERGLIQSKYFEGVMNYIDYGYANPTVEQKRFPRYEPDPIKYIWTSQSDGFFQRGSGNHYPTFAAKIDLTQDQFLKILAFMHPSNYHYPDYALTRNQCSSFVAKAAALADLPIEFEVTVPIERTLTIGQDTLTLWHDPQYASITFSSPDVIEKSLIQAVAQGRAQYALNWYKARRPKSGSQRLNQFYTYLRHLPEHLQRLELYLKLQ